MTEGQIEQRSRLRDEEPPDESVVVVRGGPDTIDKIAKNAVRTARAWTLDGEPLEGISVFCALDPTGDGSLDGVLSTMRSYRLVHLCRAGDLRTNGYELLPTATRPHYTLLPAGGATLIPERLLAALGEAQPNPFHQRRLNPPGR